MLNDPIDEAIDASFPASDPPTWTSMHAGLPADRGAPVESFVEPRPLQPSRQHGSRLAALREGLLAVHKALLEVARLDYEREHGTVGGPGTLLQLLVHDEAFAWLHPVSELAASADELLEEKDAPGAELSAIARAAGDLLTPDEDGAGFRKRYFDAIQASPDVVMAHVAVRRAIAAALSRTA